MSDAISTNNINKVIDAAFAHARTSTFLVNPKGVSLAEQLDNPAFRAMVSLDDEKVDKIGKTIKFAESTFKRGLAQAQKNYADVLTLQRGRKAKKRDEGDEEEEEMARELERNERRMKAGMYMFWFPFDDFNSLNSISLQMKKRRCVSKVRRFRNTFSTRWTAKGSPHPSTTTPTSPPPLPPQSLRPTYKRSTPNPCT